jgi:hypothetical protein
MIMNITEIRKHTIYYLETDEEGCNFYTRHSADNWSMRIGESDESVYDNEIIAELEAAFKKWVSETKSDTPLVKSNKKLEWVCYDCKHLFSEHGYCSGNSDNCGKFEKYI